MFEAFRRFGGAQVRADLDVVHGRGRPRGDEWLSGELSAHLCAKRNGQHVVFLELATRTGLPIGGVKHEIELTLEQARELAAMLERALEEA